MATNKQAMLKDISQSLKVGDIWGASIYSSLYRAAGELTKEQITPMWVEKIQESYKSRYEWEFDLLRTESRQISGEMGKQILISLRQNLDISKRNIKVITDGATMETPTNEALLKREELVPIARRAIAECIGVSHITGELGDNPDEFVHNGKKLLDHYFGGHTLVLLLR